MTKKQRNSKKNKRGRKRGAWKAKEKCRTRIYGKLQRNCISIRANCREVRENGRDHATNLLEGGNTRANKFPWGLQGGEGEGGNPGAKSDSHRRGARGVSAAFFWKIAGDPGIFVPPLSPHSKRRTVVPSPLLRRERKVIFARAHG